MQASLLAMGVGIAAFAIAELSRGSLVDAGGLVVLWPLSGVLVAILARAHRRAWPWLIAAVAAAELVSSVRAGREPMAAVGFAAGRAVEGALGAVLLQRFAGRPPRLRDLPEVGSLVLGAAVLACGLGSLIAAAAAYEWAQEPLLAVWRDGWIADALGVLLAAPVVLALPGARKRIEYISAAALLDGLTLIALTGLSALIFFGGSVAGSTAATLSYAIFPVLLLCASRLGPTGAALGMAALAALATSATAGGSGPFGADEQSILELQLFLATAATMSLCVAGAVADRRRTRETLEANETKLWSSDRRLREAQSNAQVGSWDWDLATRELQWSDELCRIHGLRPAERPADLDAWLALVHPDDRPALADATAEAGDPNAAFELEHRVVTPDGTVRWLFTRGRSGASRRGSARRLFGTSQDITRRRLAEDQRRASEERYRILLENLPDTIVTMLDRDLRVVSMEGDTQRVGRDRQDAVGRLITDILPPARHGPYVAAAEAALAGEPGEIEWRSVNGERDYWMRFRPVRDASGEVTGVLVAAADQTDLHRALAGMREAEQRFRTAFESVTIGMALLDAEGRFAQVNPALVELSGHSRGQLEAMTLSELTHPEDVERETAAWRDLTGGRAQQWRTEMRCVHATGQAVWVELSATLIQDDGGRSGLILVSIQDITERRRFQGRLQHMADHDPLTGLFNRRKFEHELSRHVQEATRYERAAAILALDLDELAAVNSALGQKAGDELMMSVAAVLRRRLRDTDVVARLGGDEFAVILPRANRAEAEIVARALVEEVRDRAVVQDRSITVSVGIAVLDNAVGSGEDALNNAEAAMYEAKARGRDRFEHFQPGLAARPRAGRRLAWNERIRAALDEDRFELHAQPLLDLRTDQITRHELLVRMTGEDGELIPPATFLSAAERFDLVQDIDRWVTSRAIDLLAAHHAAGNPLTLEVNLSAKSLDDDRLARMVEERLAGTNIDEGSLVFEISETAAVANLHGAREFAERLRGLGCRFALDDFGAGFGSFYYLKHLPFDYLKIDGEFIAHCLANRTDQLVIESVVLLARGLGKQTIAEFTSSAQHVEFLRESGVDYAQGFHVGTPRPIAEALALPGDGDLEPPRRKAGTAARDRDVIHPAPKPRRSRSKAPRA